MMMTAMGGDDGKERIGDKRSMKMKTRRHKRASMENWDDDDDDADNDDEDGDDEDRHCQHRHHNDDDDDDGDNYADDDAGEKPTGLC